MRLKAGYLFSGIVTGLVVLFSFFSTLPDGKLHIIFCDVGQGDAAYIRFPDGRDMVVDGGPNDKIIDCLSNVMPFWDRSLDLVVMSHPQKDHMQGLISVFERYQVKHFVRSNIENPSEGYVKLMEAVKAKNTPQKYMAQGETITIDKTLLQFFGPSQNILGSLSVGGLNDAGLVFLLRYGGFDVLFPGDVTLRNGFEGLADNSIEVLKVPHHGSKTGMNAAFVEWLHPVLSVISVGKNSYGHPTQEILQMLSDKGIRVIRTDVHGNIEIVSDGINWKVKD